MLLKRDSFLIFVFRHDLWSAKKGEDAENNGGRGSNTVWILILCIHLFDSNLFCICYNPIAEILFTFGLMQASSEHSVCFAVPEKEVKAVAQALESRFRQALDAGRLSQVCFFRSSVSKYRCLGQLTVTFFLVFGGFVLHPSFLQMMVRQYTH